MTTIKISDEVHVELVKIKGSLLVASGQEISFDDVIKELIKFWRKRH